MKSFDYLTDMMRMALDDTPTLMIKGRVIQVVGTIIKAVVPAVKVGEVCILRNPGEDFEMKAEVVGFSRTAHSAWRHVRHLRIHRGHPHWARPHGSRG